MIKKKIIALGLMTVITLGSAAPTFASSNDVQKHQDSTIGKAITEVVKVGKEEGGRATKSVEMHKIRTVVSKESKKGVFCGWHWPNAKIWTHYIIYKGTKFESNYTYKGVTTKIGFKTGGDITMYTEANRWHNVGAYADIKFERVSYQYYQGGMRYKTEEKLENITYTNKKFKIVYEN